MDHNQPIKDEYHNPTPCTVEKEKNNVRDAINAEINNPRAYAADRCGELMHRDDPDFPTINDLLATVSEADEKKLYAHYRKLLENSSLEVFYVGSEDIGHLSEIIRNHFGAFCGKRVAFNPIKAEAFTELKEVTEPFEVSQGKLSLGFRIGVTADDEKYFAASLFNEIFGGSPASKLFMNVREKLSLCYYCASSYNPYLGNVTVSSGIDVQDFEKAKSAILAQLEDIKQGRISDVELTAAKKSVAHWYRQMYDYPFELFAFYSTRCLLGIDASPEEYLKKFEAVTAAQVVEIAKNVKLDTVFFLKGTLEADDGEEYDE